MLNKEKVIRSKLKKTHHIVMFVILAIFLLIYQSPNIVCWCHKYGLIGSTTSFLENKNVDMEKGWCYSIENYFLKDDVTFVKNSILDPWGRSEFISFSLSDDDLAVGEKIEFSWGDIYKIGKYGKKGVSVFYLKKYNLIVTVSNINLLSEIEID